MRESGRLVGNHAHRSQRIFGVSANEARISDAINLIADAQAGDARPDGLDLS